MSVMTFLMLIVVALEGVISDSRLSFVCFGCMELDDTPLPGSIIFVTADSKRVLRNFPERKINKRCSSHLGVRCCLVCLVNLRLECTCVGGRSTR